MEIGLVYVFCSADEKFYRVRNSIVSFSCMGMNAEIDAYMFLRIPYRTKFRRTKLPKI